MHMHYSRGVSPREEPSRQALPVKDWCKMSGEHAKSQPGTDAKNPQNGPYSLLTDSPLLITTHYSLVSTSAEMTLRLMSFSTLTMSAGK